MNIRILPLVLFFAFALVVAKVVDLGLEKSTRNNLDIRSNIQASAENKPEEPAADKKKADNVKKDSESPKGEEAKKADKKDEKKEDSKEKESEAAAPAEAGKDGPTQKSPPKSIEISDQAPMEKALLESLSKRRKELDEWANTISMKESVLNATEKKISSKMEELKKLETEVTSLLAQYKAKEDEKSKKLVKIYEGMKPAEAAKILDNMDMGILLEIAGGMKEDNASKILAKMDANKARELTVKLAEQRRLAMKPK